MLKLFDVTVPGYGTSALYGRSAGEAKAKAWRCDAFWNISFMDHLAGIDPQRTSFQERPLIHRSIHVDLVLNEAVAKAIGWSKIGNDKWLNFWGADVTRLPDFSGDPNGAQIVVRAFEPTMQTRMDGSHD